MPASKWVLLSMVISLLCASKSYALGEEETASAQVLSDAFLEYLGDYENIDGEWVDPYEFAEVLEEMANLAKVATRKRDDGEVSSEDDK